MLTEGTKGLVKVALLLAFQVLVWTPTKGFAQEQPPQEVILVGSFDNLSTRRELIDYDLSSSTVMEGSRGTTVTGRRIRVDRLSAIAQSAVEDALVNAGYKVVERQRLNDILKESDFISNSGMVDPRSMVEMGKMLGANKILIGSIEEIGEKKNRFSGYGVNIERVVMSVTIKYKMLDAVSGRIVSSKRLTNEAVVAEGVVGSNVDSDQFPRIIRANVEEALSKMGLDKNDADR